MIPSSDVQTNTVLGALLTYEALLRLCMPNNESSESPLVLDDVACLAPQILRVQVADEYSATDEPQTLQEKVASELECVQFRVLHRSVSSPPS